MVMALGETFLIIIANYKVYNKVGYRLVVS